MPADRTATPHSAAPPSHGTDEASLRAFVQERLGPGYALRELVHRGAGEATFLAHDTTANRRVALTVVGLGLTLTAEQLAAIERDLATAAGVSHKGIVSPIATGRREGLVYCITEQIRGTSLDALLRSSAELPFDRIVEILRDVADALDAAHRQGVVHGDLKPSVILVGATGRAMVEQLGLARALRARGRASSAPAADSAAHMAPEQWRGEQGSAASDQYALAVIAFEMIVGRRRVDDRSTGIATLEPLEILPDVPLRPGLPLAANAALLRALSRKEQHRFLTVTAFVDALASDALALPAGEPTFHPELTREAPGAHVAAIIVGALVGIVVILAVLPPTRPWVVGSVLSARDELHRLSGPASIHEATARRARNPAEAILRSGGGSEVSGSEVNGSGVSGSDVSGFDVSGSGVSSATQSTAPASAAPAAPDSAPRPSGRGTVQVAVNGGTALVLIDGLPRGFAPYTGSLSVGRHTVKIVGLGARFSPSQGTITVTDGQTSTATFSAY